MPYGEQDLKPRFVQCLHLPVVPLLAVGTQKVGPGDAGAQMFHPQIVQYLNRSKHIRIGFVMKPLTHAQLFAQVTWKGQI